MTILKNVYLNCIFNYNFGIGPEEFLDNYIQTNAKEFILYEYELEYYIPEVEILKVQIYNNANVK